MVWTNINALEAIKKRFGVTFTGGGVVAEKPDAVIGGGGEVAGGGGAGGPGDGGDGMGGELEGLAEKGADAGLVRGERGREVGDGEK